jgi:proline iminopeptidase
MPELIPGEYDVVLNGTRIHYSVRGRGPALIAHSGGPGWDARSWGNMAGIEAFASLIVMHPRGSGLSAAPANGAYGLADYAADLDALRCHLELEKPAILGWSHGGMVALEYARRTPDGPGKLILYSTSACFGNSLKDPQQMLSALMAHQSQPWFADSMEALQDWWSGRCTTDEEASKLWSRMVKFHFRAFDGRAERYLQRTAQLPLHIAPLLTFMGSEAASMDLRPALKKLQIPALVIAGRHDCVTPLAMSEEIAREIPDARLEVFENSGHFAHVEEPERFCEVLRRFLE